MERTIQEKEAAAAAAALTITVALPLAGAVGGYGEGHILVPALVPTTYSRALASVTGVLAQSILQKGKLESNTPKYRFQN